MDFLRKNHFFLLIGTFVGTQFIAGLVILYFIGFIYLPERSLKEQQVQCLTHLEDKSYLIKQYFLENITNAERWVQAKDDKFFDAKWIGIAFYEHNGTEWILKNFQSNSIILDLYRITPTDYIKFEQHLNGPHPDIRSLSIQDSSFSEQKIIILESVNTTKSSTPHLIRISLMSDTVNSILSSNPSCPLSLFNTKGFFLLPQNNIAEVGYILRSTEKGSLNDITIATSDNYISHTKKILKNIRMVQFLETKNNNYAEVFSKSIWMYFFCLLIVGIMCTRYFKYIFQKRIFHYQNIIFDIKNKIYNQKFDIHPKDELSELDVPLSELLTNEKKKKDL